MQGRDLVRAVGDDVTADPGGFNTVSEFEDPQSPVRLVVAEHASGVTSSSSSRRRRRPPTSRQRRVTVTLRDGAMSAAYLDTPTTAIRTFARGVDRLIRMIDIFP